MTKRTWIFAITALVALIATYLSFKYDRQTNQEFNDEPEPEPDRKPHAKRKTEPEPAPVLSVIPEPGTEAKPV